MVHEWEEVALAYLRLPEENAALVRRNIVLQQQNDLLRHGNLPKSLLRNGDTIASFTLPVNETGEAYSQIEARIIDNSVRKRDNMLVINVGSDDGVAPEMGVVSGTGVVGIVSAVTSHYALVMSVLNSHSSISCRLRGTEYFGYLKWKGGSPLRACMDDVPRHAHIKKGDIVETSGFSAVFPAGIFLGRVAEIKNSSDGLAYELEILLSADTPVSSASSRPGSSLGLWCAVAVPHHHHHLTLRNVSLCSLAMGLRHRLHRRHLCWHLRHQLSSPDAHCIHPASFARANGSA